MVRYIIASSANSLMLFCILSGMSLIYMRKRQGPSTDLWGTPAKTEQEHLSMGLNVHRREQCTEFFLKGTTGSM